MNTHEAIDLAEGKDLDLVLVSSNPENPVCKLMDYGKYKFEQSKREKESKTDEQCFCSFFQVYTPFTVILILKQKMLKNS